jgi:hypothetical protein
MNARKWPRRLVKILIAFSTPAASLHLSAIHVAALVGNTYGAAKDVGAYVTGEATRGLLILKRKNVNDAQLYRNAVAAGLAERTVRIAERKGS